LCFISLSSVAYNLLRRWQHDWWTVILKGLKGRDRGLIGGLYWHVATDAEKNNENVSVPT